MYKIILIFCILISIYSCGAMYGVKEINNKNFDEEYNLFKKSYNNNSQIIYGMIGKKFFKEIKNDTLFTKEEMQKLQQPIQCFYINDKQNIVSYFVNCDAGGFPNLKWDRNNAFQYFPPKNQKFVFESQSEVINLILSNIELENSNSIIKDNNSIIVLYSLTLKRQSQNLINEILTNLNKNNIKSYSLYLINIDQQF